MTFEIYDSNGGGILEVHQLSCVPFEHLNDMVKYSGFKFKVDGKTVSAKGVKKAVYESLGIPLDDVKKSKPMTSKPKETNLFE
jgi:hypothetical protein